MNYYEFKTSRALIYLGIKYYGVVICIQPVRVIVQA